MFKMVQMTAAAVVPTAAPTLPQPTAIRGIITSGLMNCFKMKMVLAKIKRSLTLM